MSDAVVVMTRKTVEEIQRVGGSQYWKLDPQHALACTYLVCARNTKGSKGKEAHKSGFMIGRISGVEETPEDGRGRYIVQIDQFARIDIPDLWQFGRNPVGYHDLAEMGIDIDSIEFEPMPPVESSKATTATAEPRKVRPLNLAQAKEGLALFFGVSTDAIEIIVRG